MASALSGTVGWNQGKLSAQVGNHPVLPWRHQPYHTRAKWVLQASPQTPFPGCYSRQRRWAAPSSVYWRTRKPVPRRFVDVSEKPQGSREYKLIWRRSAKVIWLLITSNHFTIRTANRFWDTIFALDWVFLSNLGSSFCFWRLILKQPEKILHSSNLPNVSKILLLQTLLFKNQRGRVKG